MITNEEEEEEGPKETSTDTEDSLMSSDLKSHEQKRKKSTWLRMNVRLFQTFKNRIGRTVSSNKLSLIKKKYDEAKKAF